MVDIPFAELRSELQTPLVVATVKMGGVQLSRQEVDQWLNSKKGRLEVS